VHIPRRPRLGRVTVLIGVIVVIATTIAVLGPFSAGAQHARPIPRPHRSPRDGARPDRAGRAAAAARAAADAHAADFALLRRAPGMPTPAKLVGDLAHAPASYGLVPSMARQARDGAWLIPGASGTCLAVTAGGGIGISCAPNGATENGELRFSIRDQASGNEHITGIAPDGHSTVRAVAADGTTLAATDVTENSYELGARNPARLAVE
jgi:hypothetical protein